MHLLGCLDRPSGGTYRFNGHDVAGLDADALAWLRREAFGFVFQGYHLIPSESARENVEVPAIYAGMPEAERRARSAALLQRLGLGERLGYRPAQLSGGQQQRVSIARALMNGGRIILADEPTGALDSKSGAEVMALLHELADAGHTIILITHDRKVAQQARRVIEILDGQIVADSGSAAAPVSNLPPLDLQQAGRDGGASAWDDLREASRTAWRVMWINRFRTGLTLLGIIIGVASVIVMLAVGTGSQQRVMAEMEFSAPAPCISHRCRKAAAPAAAKLTLDDIDVIRQVPNVTGRHAVYRGQVMVRRGNIDHQTEGGGATTDFPAALNWSVSHGILFDQSDLDSLAKVAVIGTSVRKALFADGSDPIGQDILIDSVPFQVIGILTSKGAGNGEDQDERVIVPLTTAAARLYGHTNPNWIAVQIGDAKHANQTAEAISAALEKSRRAKDVRIYNHAETVRVQSETESTMTLMLGLIAAISLLVGGIGVMNVMLMTVRERTREIGIRMATGARERDIMRQFLAEAVSGLAGRRHCRRHHRCGYRSAADGVERPGDLFPARDHRRLFLRRGNRPDLRFHAGAQSGAAGSGYCIGKRMTMSDSRFTLSRLRPLPWLLLAAIVTGCSGLPSASDQSAPATPAAWRTNAGAALSPSPVDQQMVAKLWQH